MIWCASIDFEQHVWMPKPENITVLFVDVSLLPVTRTTADLLMGKFSPPHVSDTHWVSHTVVALTLQIYYSVRKWIVIYLMTKRICRYIECYTQSCPGLSQSWEIMSKFMLSSLVWLNPSFFSRFKQNIDEIHVISSLFVKYPCYDNWIYEWRFPRVCW